MVRQDAASPEGGGMKNYSYKWTKQYSVPAQVAGEIIQRLPIRSADALLKVAKVRDNPLHSQFEWEDSRAGQQYRLLQARTMINSLHVEVVDSKNTTRHIEAFVHTVDRSDLYVPTLEANSEELSKAEMDCWRQMKSFRARWKGLEFAREFVSIVNEKERSLSRRRKRA